MTAAPKDSPTAAPTIEGPHALPKQDLDTTKTRCVFQHGFGTTHQAATNIFIPKGAFVVTRNDGSYWGDETFKDIQCDEKIYVWQNTMSVKQGWNSKSLHKGLCAALTGRVDSADDQQTLHIRANLSDAEAGGLTPWQVQIIEG